MGAFMIVSMAPRLILYPIAGVMGDRMNRKWIMVTMDWGRGAVILLLASLAAQGLVTISILFIAQLAMSLMNALFGPATSAMLPDLVDEDDLMQANSTIASINSFSPIVGYALGGALYGLGGIQTIFLINSVSFVASGVSELFIRYQQKTIKPEKVQRVIDDLKEGFLFVKNHRSLLLLVLFALITNFLINPVFNVLVPYVAREVIEFTSDQFGMLYASYMGGILIGNIIIGTVLAKSTVGTLLNKGLLSQMAFFLLFSVLIFPQIVEALGYASWVMFFALASTFIFAGVTNAFVNTPLLTGLQKLAPTEYRARIFSVLEVGVQGLVPIGFGIIGILLDMAPAHLVNGSIMIVALCVTVLFVFRYSHQVIEGFSSKDTTP
jgi:predicted MFS family arabinose efflux permease